MDLELSRRIQSRPSRHVPVTHMHVHKQDIHFCPSTRPTQFLSISATEKKSDNYETKKSSCWRDSPRKKLALLLQKLCTIRAFVRMFRVENFLHFRLYSTCYDIVQEMWNIYPIHEDASVNNMENRLNLHCDYGAFVRHVIMNGMGIILFLLNYIEAIYFELFRAL